MAPVTASTNRDSQKMDYAGVEAGAKIFVGLKGGAGSAKAAAVQQTQTRICQPGGCHLVEPRDCNWFPLFRLEEHSNASQNLRLFLTIHNSQLIRVERVSCHSDD